jgi:hypothetical protein
MEESFHDAFGNSWGFVAYMIKTQKGVSLMMATRLGFQKALIILFLHVIILVQCASGGKISSHEAFVLLDQKARETNRSGVFRLEKDSSDMKGFFYLISSKGIVLSHPLGFLAGSDFSDLPFLKEILSKERGVVTQEQGGLVRSVFYHKLSDGSYLCLSIEPEIIEK